MKEGLCWFHKVMSTGLVTAKKTDAKTEMAPIKIDAFLSLLSCVVSQSRLLFL